MKQLSLGESGDELKTERTRECEFLDEMNLVVPWAALMVLIASHGPPLGAKGQLLKSGTIVDATLIAAPSSTRNSSGERDPGMRQTKKGNQWHIGMKALQGLPAKSMAVAC